MSRSTICATQIAVVSRLVLDSIYMGAMGEKLRPVRRVVGGFGAHAGRQLSRLTSAWVLVSGIGGDEGADDIRAELAELSGVMAVESVCERTPGNSVFQPEGGQERTILDGADSRTAWTRMTEEQMVWIDNPELVLAGGTLTQPILTQLLQTTAPFLYLNLTRIPGKSVGLGAAQLVQVSLSDAANFSAAGTDPRRLAEALFQTGVRRVVVTSGSAGSTYYDQDGVEFHAAAPVVDASETTGAGDTFAAAASWAISQHGVADVEQWLLFASHAAGFFVENGFPGSAVQIAERFSL